MVVLYPRLLVLLGGALLALALLWGAGVFSPGTAYAQTAPPPLTPEEKRLWEQLMNDAKSDTASPRRDAAREAAKNAYKRAPAVLNTVGKGLTFWGAGSIWYDNYLALRPLWMDNNGPEVVYIGGEFRPAPGAKVQTYKQGSTVIGQTLFEEFTWDVDNSGNATIGIRQTMFMRSWVKNSYGCGEMFSTFGGPVGVEHVFGGTAPGWTSSCLPYGSPEPTAYQQIFMFSRTDNSFRQYIPTNPDGTKQKVFLWHADVVDNKFGAKEQIGDALPIENGSKVRITPDTYEAGRQEILPEKPTGPIGEIPQDQSVTIIREAPLDPAYEPFITPEPTPTPTPTPVVDPTTDPDCAGLTPEQCRKLQDQKKKHGAVVWTRDNPDGSKTFRFQDGHEWTVYADGTTFEKFANGVEKWTYPDGTIRIYDPRTGKLTIKYPDGTTRIIQYPVNTPAEDVWSGSAPAPTSDTWTDPGGQVIPNPNPADPTQPQPYPNPPPTSPPPVAPPPPSTQPGCLCPSITFVGPGIAFEEKFPFSLILYVYEGWKQFAAAGTDAPSFTLLPGSQPMSVAPYAGFIKGLRSIMLVVALMGLCWVMWEAIKKDK